MPSIYLEVFQNALASLGRPVVAVLAPGVPEADVYAALGDETPDAVVEWFTWCNGVLDRPGQRNDDVALIPGYAPVSIVDAVALRAKYVGDGVLAPTWIPLLAGPSGDLFAAVWSHKANASVAGVLIGEPTEIEFDNIRQMVDFFIACIERGAFFVNEQQMWSVDPDLYDAVYAEIASGGA
ncbi:hypothetical protein [Luedemannella helvata]|uniref:Uncharacterized protein n=1 Tax=Luedemannella helvata TaxID=349315 RepID=A0ABP4WY59_9ACTN